MEKQLLPQSNTPINPQDLNYLETAHALLGTAISAFKAKNPSLGWDLIIKTDETIRFVSGANVKLSPEVLAPRAQQAPKAPVQPAPELPKDGTAQGHIPGSILKGPSNADILSHVMERVNP